jgi:hypothetical protein
MRIIKVLMLTVYLFIFELSGLSEIMMDIIISVATITTI